MSTIIIAKSSSWGTPTNARIIYWARARAFRIYANTGAWVNAEPGAYALTEYNADAGEHTVEVYEYTDAGPKRLNGGTVKV